MTYQCPPQIYKYLSFDGAIKTLEKRSVKLSRPSDFNDPLDLYLQESFGTDVREFAEDMKRAFHDFVSGEIDYNTLRNNPQREMIILMNQAFQRASPEQAQEIRRQIIAPPIEDLYDLESLEERNEETVAALQNSFEKHGVFCSTTNHHNLLMWAHYAEQHKGAVFEFTPSIDRDSVFLASKPVMYSDTRPLLYRSADDMVRHGLTMPLQESVTEILDSLIFTKSTEWSYEQEYRLAVPDYIPESGDFQLLNFGSDELTSVYFGCRMDDGNKRAMKSLVKTVNPDTKMYQAVPSKREYVLNF